MSRPRKATVDYFPHYVNHGKTMFTIEAKYGNDGYAFWFKLLEILGSSENHYIDCNETETWEFLLAKTRFNEDNANVILKTLSNINAIDSEMWDKRIIWSENFTNNLLTVYNRREINVLQKPDIMGLLYTETQQCGAAVVINPQSKVKESKVKESNTDIEVENFNNYLTWISLNCKNIQLMKNQMTSKQLNDSLVKHGSEKVRSILSEMDNWNLLLKKNNSVYLTLENWIRRRDQESKAIQHANPGLTPCPR